MVDEVEAGARMNAVCSHLAPIFGRHRKLILDAVSSALVQYTLGTLGAPPNAEANTIGNNRLFKPGRRTVCLKGDTFRVCLSGGL
jgi:hypothetical protein